MSVSALAGHIVNWQGDGTPINNGLTYVVRGFKEIDPIGHLAFYRNTTTGCRSNAATINTQFAPCILLNNSTAQTVCDTSFYNAGGLFNLYQGSNNFTKTFFPATPGKKIKLSIYNLSLGQFSFMDIIDGADASASRIDQLDRNSTNTLREYTASNNDGAITVSFRANSSTAAGWLAGITCEEPLQFRSVQNGLFTDVINWESKLPSATVYTPAVRRPNKGDDTILIRHAISVATGSSLPLDQTVIEPAGSLTIPANTNVLLYSDKNENDITVKGALTVNGNIFGISNSRKNGKIALEGTLNLQGEIIIDSILTTPAATAPIMNTTGSPNISRLQVNNTAGITINGNLNISQTLNLINGVVKVTSPGFVKLAAGNGPEIIGGSANSYIEGRLRWEIFSTSDPIVFPVGKMAFFEKLNY